MSARFLLRALERALADSDLEGRTQHAIARTLSREIERDAPTVVIAVGKASLAMARGARAALHRSQVKELLVVAPEGARLNKGSYHAKYMHAPHPLPDERSVAAAKLAFKHVHWTEEGQVVVVLLSGGASAMLAMPPEGLSLEKKRQITRALLRAGVSITVVNTARRHLSLVKGGGLLRAAMDTGARVVTVLVSDVLFGAAHDIGSGPSVPDPTTNLDARGALFAIPAHLRDVPLVPTLKPSAAPRSRVVFIHSPELFAKELAALLGRGASALRARVLAPSIAPVEALATEYVQIAHKLQPGRAVVRAAEPSVHVERRGGRGGRATHLAALVAPHLPEGVTFMAAATDGVDGTSGTAGAIVDRSTFEPLSQAIRDRAIARFDTGPLVEKAGAAIDLGGPTGVNFGDVHVLVRASRRARATSRS